MNVNQVLENTFSPGMFDLQMRIHSLTAFMGLNELVQMRQHVRARSSSLRKLLSLTSYVEPCNENGSMLTIYSPPI